MYRKIWMAACLAAGMLAYCPAQAQTYSSTALLFSQNQFAGSARYQGIGGAATALGGDLSSAYINPAGLGFNEKSEFSFTPSYGYSIANASLNGGTSWNDTKTKLSLGSMGISFAGPRKSSEDFRGGTFAITYNQTNNFNETFTYSGVNDQNSIVDKIMNDADGKVYHDDLYYEAGNNQMYDLIGLAFNNYMINPVDTIRGANNSIKHIFNDAYSTFWFEPVRQRETVVNSGSQGVINFAYGGNFSDRIYFGASLGIHRLNYTQAKTYSEESIAKQYEFDYMEFKENVNIKGSGMSLTLGLLFRPSNLLRLGFSATTPTVYRVTDTYNASLYTVYNDDQIYSTPFYVTDTEYYNFTYQLPGREFYSETQKIQSDYKITTPFRVQGGAAVFLGKAGFLSADIEYLNYSLIRLGNPNPSNLPFDGENQYVQQNLNQSVNIKLGGELRLSALYLRGGLGYQGSPYQKIEALDWKKIQTASLLMSAGVGIRTKKFYTDFTLTGRNSKRNYSPYTLSQNTPVAAVSMTRIQGVCTVGFYF